jgi:hypothetical protein
MLWAEFLCLCFRKRLESQDKDNSSNRISSLQHEVLGSCSILHLILKMFLGHWHRRLKTPAGAAAELNDHLWHIRSHFNMPYRQTVYSNAFSRNRTQESLQKNGSLQSEQSDRVPKSVQAVRKSPRRPLTSICTSSESGTYWLTGSSYVWTAEKDEKSDGCWQVVQNPFQKNFSRPS